MWFIGGLEINRGCVRLLEWSSPFSEFLGMGSHLTRFYDSSAFKCATRTDNKSLRFAHTRNFILEEFHRPHISLSDTESLTKSNCLIMLSPQDQTDNQEYAEIKTHNSQNSHVVTHYTIN